MNTNRGTAGQLATIKPQDGSVQWTAMYDQATALVKSGFLPPSIKNAEQAIAIILTGDELGIPKMLALRSIHVIQGRPTLSADLMASLVQREIDRHKDGLLMVLPPTATECTVRFRRWGWKDEQSFTYTLDDAKTAGLVGKDTWKAHPGAMLRARATAAVCRMAFPDVIAGLYAPEEITQEEAESWSTTEAQAHVEARVVDTAIADEPSDDTPLTGIEELRRELWAAAQAMGYEWAHFNKVRRESGLPNLEQMDAQQVEEAYAALSNHPTRPAQPAQGNFIDAESRPAGEPGLDRHSA